MHLETAHPQRLAPRLPQRLVRRYAIQSVQVLQAETAADQRADQTPDRTPDGTADTGGSAQLVLRGFIAAAIGFCAATRLRAAWGRRWRWRWRGFVFISVWHDPSPKFGVRPRFHTRKQHPTARAAVCRSPVSGCMLQK